jgi:hypothetical protein
MAARSSGAGFWRFRPRLDVGSEILAADTHRRFLRGCIFGRGCESRRLHSTHRRLAFGEPCPERAQRLEGPSHLQPDDGIVVWWCTMSISSVVRMARSTSARLPISTIARSNTTRALRQRSLPPGGQSDWRTSKVTSRKSTLWSASPTQMLDTRKEGSAHRGRPGVTRAAIGEGSPATAPACTPSPRRPLRQSASRS